MAGGRNSKTMADIGNGVIITGLILQLLWFIFFIVVASAFHHRMKLVPTVASRQSEIRWQSYLYTLYLVSGLIIVRSLFRMIEFVEGSDGYLLSNEAFLYVFDTLPMFFMVWLHWKHPGEIGVLLRGEKAYQNGFKLITARSR